ncbi:class I SAM-dependent methyltransferase [Vibrio ouci]|uniref:Class I SAM-dependent methyltransferase n=1 Tax=Vibrio ouci TaxID=2499078 RepID=A0A4Y8WIG2_9VIBR|nr:class I SAM-dependent methyltransferase [Vibrio ouci]TFH92720.1 class I SAM-dependent methyltransferase [Vibrio ouci]
MKSELYSTYAKQYDSVITDNIYNAHLDRPTLLSMLGSVSGLNVMDLGCGPGVYSQYLLESDASKITCVDYSDEMVELVKEKFGGRVSTYQQDLSLGLPKEKSASVDVMICPLVLHYLEDLSLFFNEVSRVLKPKGYIVFSTHHPFADFECSKSGNYFERELVEEEWNTVGTPVPIRFYRRSLMEITDAITSSGLVISQLSEGKVSDKVKELDEDVYERLSRNPNFIFMKCSKLGD